MSDEREPRLDAVQSEGSGAGEIETHPDLLALSERHRTSKWQEWPEMEPEESIIEKEWSAVTTLTGEYAVIVWGARSSVGVICMGKHPMLELAEYVAKLHNQNLARKHAEQDAAKEAGGTETTRSGLVGGLGETEHEGPVDS